MFGPLKFSQLPDNSSQSHFDFRSDELLPCILCDTKFSLPSKTDEFCLHLFEDHRLVIADVPLIANFKSYVNYWRHRFQYASITWFCSVFVVNSTQGDTTDEQYYLLSDVNKVDRLLREGLHLKRLEAILLQQESERKQILSRPCLLCSFDFTGPRADYFQHLSVMHNLQLGHPENLVFTNELLDAIDQKLERLECLFCHKIFTDRSTLKEHMRKKQHKRINPNDKTFDQFYIVNYLEIGKTWQDIQNEPEEIDPHEEVSDWSDWDDTDEIEPPVVCLYCELTCPKFEEILEHMKSEHHFDFDGSCKKLNLSFYNQIKVVNYIRHQIYMGQCTNCVEKLSSRQELLEHMHSSDHVVVPDKQLWDQPEYFFPTYENDAFLCYLNDVEDSSNH